VLNVLAIDDVRVDGLPRDRLDLEGVAAAEEMDELKASIRARGQREPIEVYVDAAGRFQLKKGWRRLTALRSLLEETGDARFATVVARIGASDDDRVALYVDMVEENAVRQDLTFAEMAAVALKAAQDPAAGLGSVDEAVSRLYASLQKTKRSYIRQFASSRAIWVLRRRGRCDCGRSCWRGLRRGLGRLVLRRNRTRL
jgi:ParB family chromosome partitioning protein